MSNDLTFQQVCRMLADDPESWQQMEYRAIDKEWYGFVSPAMPVVYVDRGTPVRLRLRTIRIGDYDVPEPLREAPEKWTVVYQADTLAESGAVQTMWRGDSADYLWLRRGRLHATQEAAQLHARAEIEQAGGTFETEE